MRQYEVNGFSFYTKEEAALAELESKRVDYMQDRMEYDNPLRVLSIYNKAIDEGIFQGQVGIAYLRKIQDYLWNQPDVPKDQIQSIPAGEGLAPGADWREETVHKRREASIPKNKKTEKKVDPQLFKFSVIMNIAFIIAIIAMFAITLNSENPNILNYEKNLQNKYATWEQQLREKEAELKNWE